MKGRIGVYNVSNGQLMKTTHFDNESVVVAIQYFDEEKRFVAGYENGLTCIFDENDMEDCHLIRSFEHFNRHQELTTLKFDPHSRAVATAGGSSNVARLWSYDSGKCETELLLGINPSIIIVNLIILHPYPLVVTSDTTGNIIVWGSRGTRWQGLRISGFLNLTPSYAEYEKRIRKPDEEEDMTPLRAFPPPIAQHSARRGMKRNDSDKGHQLPPTRQRGLRNSFNPLSEALRVDPILKANSETTCRQTLKESEDKWGKVSAAQTMCWDNENTRLYTGDDMGNIRCFDLFDVFQDLRVDSLLEDTTRHRILGLCRGRMRNQQSALPPMFEENISDEFDAAGAHYLLGHPGNAMSYLGVQFIWSLLGHSDRIIQISLVPSFGLLTSGADRLVKMWNFDGKPIGTLLQSVPVGTKSRSWDLSFNIDRILQEENKNLDKIIESARAIAESPSKPDIDRMDFRGMQVGSESADFSKSELRQRIEKSAKILGLDFPQDSKHFHVNGLHDNNGHKKDDATIGDQSLASSATGGKSLVEALKEIKSTDSAVDYELKTKQMTIIQQKRKAHKLLSISKEYEAKTGVKVKLKPEKEHHSSHHQLVEDDEEKSVAELDKLLTATSHFAKLAREQQEKDDNIADNGVTTGGSSVMEEQSITEMNSSISLDNTNPSPTQTNYHQNHRNSTVGGKHASIKSKILDSIKDVQNRGPRTISMIQSCRKYTAYSALDEAMNASSKESAEHRLTLEEMAELRANRERKHRELLASMILNETNKNSNHNSRSNTMIRSKSVADDGKHRLSLATAVTQSTGKTGKLSTNFEDSLESMSRTEVESKMNSSQPPPPTLQPVSKQASGVFSTIESLPSND